MKKNCFKNNGMLVLAGLLLMLFAPTDSYAQKHHNKKKGSAARVTTPVKHYQKVPRRGAHVTVLPQKAVVIRHGRYDYHFHDGIFYRPINGSYVVVAPSIGVKVNALPPAVFRLHHFGRPYFYYHGVFYFQLPGGDYEVVDAPIGARIDALPDGYEIFELDDKVYYRLDDTYYKAVVEENGNVVYEVVRV